MLQSLKFIASSGPVCLKSTQYLFMIWLINLINLDIFATLSVTLNIAIRDFPSPIHLLLTVVLALDAQVLRN